jgi:hypothetical protein
VTALVTAVLDEGLKIGRFSGIVYRDGPTGRRAGLAAGPDVWEVSVTSNKRLGPAKVVLSSLPSKRAYPCSRFGWRWTLPCVPRRNRFSHCRRSANGDADAAAHRRSTPAPGDVRWLLDEMLPLAAARQLNEQGHDAVSVYTLS